MKIVPTRPASRKPEQGPVPTAIEQPQWLLPAPVLFAVMFSVVWLLHAPLMRLPYFWDEAGYFVPAARDLLLTGRLIPTSTLSNAHPPLVMAWLAFWWKFFAYTPAVTRTAMLLVSAFALLGVFRLARQVCNVQVAAAATLLTALYPVFFAQSSLAQLDMMAAALTIWGLDAYLRGRARTDPATSKAATRSGFTGRAAIWFALAGLAKETALVTPLALAGYEILWALWSRRSTGTARPRSALGVTAILLARDGQPDPEWATHKICPVRREPARNNIVFLPAPAVRPGAVRFAPIAQLSRHCLILAASVLPLAAWLAYHYVCRGYVFGNPEYFRYNVAATLDPLRIVLALLERLWQLFGYLNMFVLTGAAALALKCFRPDDERPPIAPRVQRVFAAVMIAYVAMLSTVGGAVLARYLLPVYPLVIILSVAALWRRVSWWRVVVGVAAVVFVAGLFVVPAYRIAPEDNLTYADFVRLHQQADEELTKLPAGRVLTAWPATDELRKPYLGYIRQAIPITAIDNFTLANITKARAVCAPQRAQAEPANSGITARAAQATLADRVPCSYALIFSTKFEPVYQVSEPWWTRLQTRFFDYHRDLPPQVAAELLGGKIIWHAQRGQEWAAIIALDNKPDSTQITRSKKLEE